MSGLAIKYETSLFGAFEAIKPEQPIITKLLDSYKEFNFIPSTYTEIKLPDGSRQTRLKFLSTESGWNIDFDTKRINIYKHITSNKSDEFGSIEEFADQCVQIIDRTSSIINIMCNRFTLITSDLIESMDSDKLKTIYEKFILPIPLYAGSDIKEWNFRSVISVPARINELDEHLNLITIVKRVQGELSVGDKSDKFDRIGLDIEINTHQDIKTDRLAIGEYSKFIELALSHRNTLVGQVKEKLQ